MRSKIFYTLAMILFTASELFAHGTGYRQSDLKAVALEFFYSTGEKMSYREARVFSPKDEKFAIQSGRTDEQGRFAFIPDSAGEWRVIVRDEEGHQCTASINISEEWLVNASGERLVNSEKENIFVRALLGVSLIFNIAAFILYRRTRHAH